MKKIVGLSTVLAIAISTNLWAGCEKLAHTTWQGKSYNSETLLNLNIIINDVLVQSYHEGGATYILNGSINSIPFKFSSRCSDQYGQITSLSLIGGQFDFYSSLIEDKRISLFGYDRNHTQYGQYLGFVEKL